MSAKRTMRRSVSLPLELSHRVNEIARKRQLSTNKVILDLIEKGIGSQEMEKKHFLALADALVKAKDPGEQKRLKAELARMTFGE
jgi:predicted DNA-binding protein